MDGRATPKRGAPSAASVPSVAIVGYTNAGKSSLLNRLTGAGVLVRGRAVRHSGSDDPEGRAR